MNNYQKNFTLVAVQNRKINFFRTMLLFSYKSLSLFKTNVFHITYIDIDVYTSSGFLFKLRRFL